MTGIAHGPGYGDAAADGHDLGDAQSLAAAINEEVSLHPPDPAWSTAFELERTRLQAPLPGVFAQVEHIGSTAVPGLVAKPVVDIMAGVASLAGVDATIATLCRNGYATSKEFNASIADTQVVDAMAGRPSDTSLAHRRLGRRAMGRPPCVQGCIATRPGPGSPLRSTQDRAGDATPGRPRGLYRRQGGLRAIRDRSGTPTLSQVENHLARDRIGASG